MCRSDLDVKSRVCTVRPQHFCACHCRPLAGNDPHSTLSECYESFFTAPASVSLLLIKERSRSTFSCPIPLFPLLVSSPSPTRQSRLLCRTHHFASFTLLPSRSTPPPHPLTNCPLYSYFPFLSFIFSTFHVPGKSLILLDHDLRVRRYGGGVSFASLGTILIGAGWTAVFVFHGWIGIGIRWDGHVLWGFSACSWVGLGQGFWRRFGGADVVVVVGLEC